jgi:hypothetical protein
MHKTVGLLNPGAALLLAQHYRCHEPFPGSGTEKRFDIKDNSGNRVGGRSRFSGLPLGFGPAGGDGLAGDFGAPGFGEHGEALRDAGFPALAAEGDGMGVLFLCH